MGEPYSLDLRKACDCVCAAIGDTVRAFTPANAGTTSRSLQWLLAASPLKQLQHAPVDQQ